ncbi:MAG: argininosuccinate lyase [Candidatus Daviesbacteria bacterium]|nr:argininosuccinate lyase [Candidatus Daviesbacteria bacterium]
MDKPKLEASSFIVSGEQMELDIEMAPFDIWGTIVHVLMLVKQGIIDKAGAKACLKALIEIDKEMWNGQFAIDPNKGAQLTLEAKLVEKAGEAAYSIHTGRSRNDQVMVVELLYLREQMLKLSENVISLVESLLKLAITHKQTVMPGYTHMQPGKITTVGQWVAAYLNGFLRTLDTIKYYLDLYDMNPLGACESYGTSWPLDREFTAEYLGFAKVWEIPQDAISSRGFAQLGYLTAISEICLVASKLNEDLILFSTFEYGMIELGDEVSQRMHSITGSSVMAQKKNPDVLEIIRSTTPQIIGFWSIVANILSSLPMGYNRDSRESKKFIHLGLTKTISVVGSLQKVISTLKVNEKRMLELATSNYSLTTDLADFISQKTKIGYRLIYQIIGQLVDEAIKQGNPLSQISAAEIIQKAAELNLKIKISDEEITKAVDPKLVIIKRKNVGGSNSVTMDKLLDDASKNIKKQLSWIQQKQTTIKDARQKTDKLVKEMIS